MGETGVIGGLGWRGPKSGRRKESGFSSFYYPPDDAVVLLGDALTPSGAALHEHYDINQIYCTCKKVKLHIAVRRGKLYLQGNPRQSHGAECGHVVASSSQSNGRRYRKAVDAGEANAILDADVRRMAGTVAKRGGQGTAAPDPLGRSIARKHDESSRGILRRSLNGIGELPEELREYPVLFHGKARLRTIRNDPRNGYRNPYFFLEMMDWRTGRKLYRFYRWDIDDMTDPDRTCFVSLFARFDKQRGKWELIDRTTIRIVPMEP